MIARSFALAAAAVVAAGSTAIATDRLAREAGPRSPVELCCVEAALLPPLETSGAPDSRDILDLNLIAPVSEAKPGLDGADWSCWRPDGSRRCFSLLRDQ
jgi:hypothetical protein